MPAVSVRPVTYIRFGMKLRHNIGRFHRYCAVDAPSHTTQTLTHTLYPPPVPYT
jgi:hypothetical protein